MGKCCLHFPNLTNVELPGNSHSQKVSGKIPYFLSLEFSLQIHKLLKPIPKMIPNCLSVCQGVSVCVSLCVCVFFSMCSYVYLCVCVYVCICLYISVCFVTSRSFILKGKLASIFEGLSVLQIFS